MSFLQKFKGKTHVLNQEKVYGLLGSASMTAHSTKNKVMQTQMTENLLKNPQKTNKSNQKMHKITLQTKKSQKSVAKENPFLVSNPFYLDEAERQRDQKIKREKLLKERLEHQKRKRQEHEAKMAQSQKIGRKKITISKQWIQLGGLGPNLGGEQWKKKKYLQDKMLKFAEEIKAINLQKMKNSYANNSQFSKSSIEDPRSRAIRYSKNIPKPLIIRKRDPSVDLLQVYEQGGQEQVSQSDLVRYQRRHQELKQMLGRY